MHTLMIRNYTYDGLDDYSLFSPVWRGVKKLIIQPASGTYVFPEVEMPNVKCFTVYAPSGGGFRPSFYWSSLVDGVGHAEELDIPKLEEGIFGTRDLQAYPTVHTLSVGIGTHENNDDDDTDMLLVALQKRRFPSLRHLVLYRCLPPDLPYKPEHLRPSRRLLSSVISECTLPDICESLGVILRFAESRTE
jgi:hypothetical protein